MTQCVVYQYDPVTGIITGTNSADRIANDPFLSLPGHIAMTDFIQATMITTHPDRPQESIAVQVHGGGWSFVLDGNGNPTLDANDNYVLQPPAWVNLPPTVHDYAVLGHIKSGALNPVSDINPRFVVGLNRGLSASGLSTLAGQTVQTTPIRSCTSSNASLKFSG